VVAGDGRRRVGRKRTAEEEAAWQAVRQIVLRRDEWRCVDCRQRPPRNELDVHHLIPRAAGGQDVPWNCVTLCDGCHAGRHPNLQVSLARRTIERWALRLARWLDVRKELPAETQALDAGLQLFGVDRFREGQMDAVLGALRGESMLVVRPTGSGKSLCFQLPAVLKGQPASYVLTPTKALMVDQTVGLHRRRLPATFVNSDIGRSEKTDRYELLDAGAWSMIYFAPERFGEKVNVEELGRLLDYRPSFLVIDEAHCVDSWGQDFRPDYGRLGELRELLGNPPVLALTATAGLETQQRILESLGIPKARILLTDVDRPNISLVRVLERSTARRVEIIARLLDRLEGRALIFVATKRIGYEVQAAIAAVGFDLPFFHGQLSKRERDSLQGRFSGQLDPPLQVLVTTNAFGMGVDVPDVRLVVHWQHPHTIEDYLQEFGRAGRDGKPALALLFSAGPSETGLLAAMARFTTDRAKRERTLTELEAAHALGRRAARIEQTQALVAQRQRCFRAGLNEVLQGKPKRRWHSPARWVLGLVFSRRRKITPAGVCCDHCNPELVGAVRKGTYPLDGTPFGGTVSRSRRIRNAAKTTIAALSGLLVLLVVLYLGIGVVQVLTEGETNASKASKIYDRYLLNRTNSPYSERQVRHFHGYYLTCAHPTDERHPSTLCLLIHPNRPARRRIGGSYHRIGRRHYACRGAARDLAICRSR
jgi:ATP-dependent DNA helicase RecQ